MELLIFIPILLGFISGLVLYLKKLNKKISDIILLTISTLTLIICVILCFGKDVNVNLFNITNDISIYFNVDTISNFFSVLISSIFMLVAIYSIKYMTHENNVNKFYTFYLITLSGLVGLCYTGNLITMYLFFELVTLFSMPLVMHSKSQESIKAAMKYLYYSLGGAFLGLISVIVLQVFSSNGGTFILGGSLDLTKIGSSESFVLVAILCGLIGFGTKAGMFPMQSWLPSAHPVAPSPASSVLSGIITKAGVFVIIRLIFYVIGTDFIKGTFVQYIWIILILITILLGSSLALLQKNFKKRLAYSSISQLSYVLLGISMLNETALQGSFLHIASHAFIKVGLFLIAGILLYKFNMHNVDEMEGLGKKMPITMWCFTLFSLGLVGVPPTGAFASKWYLATGALNSGLGALGYICCAVLLISAILTAVYLFEITIKAFLPKDHSIKYQKEKESLLMIIPLIVLVSGMFVVGIFSGYLVDIVAFIM